MSDHIESLVNRLAGAMAADRVEGRDDDKNLKAVLWEINAEAWESGVMWKGGIGTVKPERPPNPYLEPPLVLPTEPTWGIAVTVSRMVVGQWRELNSVTLFNQVGNSVSPRDIADFIPLTDEQVARIEAAR